MKPFQSRGIGPASRWCACVRHKTSCRHGLLVCDEGGFTLIELLIVCVVTPLIIGALAMGLLAAFQLQSSVSNRLLDSGDAQVVTATFQSDVQSASYVTTQSASTPQCGTGTQLLGLEWNIIPATGVFQNVVSYDIVTNSGTSTTYSLVRHYCTNGSMTPSNSSTLSYDLPVSQAPPTVICASTAKSCATSTQWISAQDVLTVKFDVTEHASNYEYTLLAVPAGSAASQPAGSPIVNTTITSCGFASPNTGTYASTLCFVDFSALKNSQNMAVATSGVGCGLEMSASLPGNFTLYFCVSISGSPIEAAGFPTYSQAFLGNSIGGTPFYIGVPGSPALYQYQSGSTDTITISGIAVNNPQGSPATGWEAVGSDAETTDPNESLTFTSDKPLNILPNTPASPMGDACNAPLSGGGPGLGGTQFTGAGTTSVTCTSSWQATAPRTGTDMVWATTPSNITATMHGAGLEGISFGLLLS
jgi:type II secretory pathway pseudopilin PulG